MYPFHNYYFNTNYWVIDFKNPILVGEVSNEVDEVLLNHQLNEWAYITAYNPLSFQLSDKENEIRNQTLWSKLSDYFVLEGQGQGIVGDWPPEKSYFVAGISKAEAIRLAQVFGQKAIVYGRINSPAELIQTLDFVGNPKLLTYRKRYLVNKLSNTPFNNGWFQKVVCDPNERNACFISSFETDFEINFAKTLLEHDQLVIIVLARELDQLDPDIDYYVRLNRLLIISPFTKDIKISTNQTIVYRNNLIREIADDIMHLG